MVDSIPTVTIWLLVISWVVVGLRCGVRTFLVKSFGLDDWLMLLSQALYTTWGIFLLLGTSAGLGKHMATLTPAQIVLAMKLWLICGALYCITATVVKVAVGFFLLRVIVNPVQKWVIWGTLAVALGFGLFLFFGTIFQCSPVSYFWDTSQEGSCSNKTGGAFVGYIGAGINATTDLILAGIPYFMLRHSNLGLKKKLAIYTIMSLGSLGAISTLIRVKTLDDLAKNDDYLYNITGLTIWSWIEPGVGIICGSIATLRPLIRTVWEKTGISKSTTKSRSTNNARFDPEVNLDDLRGELGVTRTQIEARDSPQPPRRSLESGGSDWQSFGSEEHLQNQHRIKRSVKVTIETSDAADSANDIASVRSPTVVKRVL
ncbi:putative integral membrane protein [Neofusicoccum parvum]|uniref:Integral membrane protein n=1 Tax=Neofusicoccum parvum TaxID=310453 RepID=A0ACB5S2A4_9PEZI|nr:putative integral membrane protein [Neofusicoccum parvum]GME65598.1 putative integral membrane protein [Neofusicoccum parvum]